jgi:transposase
MAIHCGIDVSKNWCDFSALGADGIEDLRFSNDEDGFIRLRFHLCGRIADAHICMEATGGYEKALCSYLSRLGATASVAEPLSVKRLGEALRVVHKTDKLDAQLLAEYCKIVKPAPMVMEDPSKQDLSQLVNVWKDLQAQGLQVRNRLKTPLLPDAARQALEDTLNAIDKAMKRVREAMDELVEGDEQLSQDCRLLESVKGIGHSSALQILAALPAGFRSFSPRELASYCGLVPRIRESGTSVRGKARLATRCNRRLRTTLYMPALVARTHCPHLRAFADRLLARGKAKKAVIAAVMRKLAHAIWAILVRREPYDGAKLCPTT